MTLPAAPRFGVCNKKKSDEHSASQRDRASPGARSRAALDLVRNHVIGAMAVGMLPLPLLDIALLTALQLRMIARAGARPALEEAYRVAVEEHRFSILHLLLGFAIGLWFSGSYGVTVVGTG